LGLFILKLRSLTYDQTPENGTEAPLLRANWPIACEPTVCASVAVACRHVTDIDPLAGIVPVGAALHETATPPICSLPPVTATLDVPVLVSVTVHWLLFATVVPAVPAVHFVTCADTCAELVNDPNRPNTNPAMAMAAMRVIAMRMTVAKTGLIAFLRLALLICIVCCLSTRRSQRTGLVRRSREPRYPRMLHLRSSLLCMTRHL